MAGGLPSGGAEGAPASATFVGDLALVDYLPEDVAPGEDCGGGMIAVTVSLERRELESVEVRDFLVAGLPNSQLVPFEPGQVPLAKDGSFASSGPVPGLPAVTSAIDGRVDLDADPMRVTGNLSISLGPDVTLCATTFEAVFSEQGLPAVTPTPPPIVVPGPGSLTFSGAIQDAQAHGSTGFDLGPCGGGEVTIVVDAAKTSVLSTEVTGFLTFGGSFDRTLIFAPGDVPIDPHDGSFAAEASDPNAPGPVQFIEGTFDFEGTPPSVSGLLGTRGQIVCEASFSGLQVGAATPTSSPRLPDTGSGGQAASSGVFWIATAGAGAALGLLGLAGALRRRTPC
jgi:hypothetical protein